MCIFFLFQGCNFSTKLVLFLDAYKTWNYKILQHENLRVSIVVALYLRPCYQRRINYILCGRLRLLTLKSNLITIAIISYVIVLIVMAIRPQEHCCYKSPKNEDLRTSAREEL